MNICGCLVHAAPGQAASVQQTAAAMVGVEVHAITAEERLVVVVEDTAEAPASEQIMALHQIPGVISVTLTYHHFEDPADGESRPKPVSAPCTP